MKLQFSLATLLVCMTVLAVACIASVTIPIYEKLDTNRHVPIVEGGIYIVGWTRSDRHRPTREDIAWRSVVWGPAAIAGTVVVLWAIRRLKSRRHTEPPVG